MFPKIAIGAALAGAALLGAIAVGYSNAQTSSSAKAFNDQEKEAIGEIVHDYLMDHPDVIIDALNEYSERERAKTQAQLKDSAKANLSELLNEEDGVVAGKDPSTAKVAVVEFFDYHCPYCKKAADVVEKLADKDASIKIVYREYPILREESEYAAKVALAARKQGKYEEIHKAFMDSSGILTKDRIKEIAAKAGVDFSAAEKDLDDPSIKKALDETHRIGREMAINGTPTFIVASTNGAYVDVIPGLNTDMLDKAIADAKKAAKKK